MLPPNGNESWETKDLEFHLHSVGDCPQVGRGFRCWADKIDKYLLLGCSRLVPFVGTSVRQYVFVGEGKRSPWGSFWEESYI